ncbi:MAG: GntR family transcriptional regulator [Trueperaceae bacterium]
MTSARLNIDKKLPTPAYLQLREQLSRAIRTGELLPGSALPSERELSETLALSRMTVRRAFEELVSEGLVEQRQGSGTFVREGPVEQTIDRLQGFGEEASRLGLRPGGRMLEVDRHPADGATARWLEVSPGEPLLRLTRLRTADDAPLALQVAHLAPHLADLALERLEELGSLYRAIAAQYGIEASRARQTIGARMPTARERGLLDLDSGVPVLAMERTTYDADGRPFEFVRSAYRGDRYRMALDLRAQAGTPGRGA